MVRWNVTGTFVLSKNHPDKFSLVTPTLAWSAIELTWQFAPTSSRIVEDKMCSGNERKEIKSSTDNKGDSQVGEEDKEIDVMPKDS